MTCLQFCKEAHSDAVWAQAICDCVSMTLFNFLLVRLQFFDLVAIFFFSVQSKVYFSILRACEILNRLLIPTFCFHSSRDVIERM